MVLRLRSLATVTAMANGLALLVPGVASAHSLDSSTLSVVVGENAVEAAVSVPAATLVTATGTDATEAAVAYLDQHLTVTGADGAQRAETWSDPVRETIESVDSLTVDVVLDPAGADPSAFTIAYDAIIEADPEHEAVVVLTDAAGDISTAGVLTATDGRLDIGASTTGLADMVGLGFTHVLHGADHLMFLVALLLVAPLVATAGRWRRRDGIVPVARDVIGVVTAFTVGHSLTLLASALGWVALPSAPVEVLVAVSVMVAAVHAVRPLARNGERVIAGLFGLVHGLAFAGILTELGLDGSTSVPALLAFNVGVELAQLATVALVVSSLYLASRTRFYPVLRLAGAAVAFAAAAAWALDRLGVLTNPLTPVEDALIEHLWYVVVGLAVLALGFWLLDRRRRRIDGSDTVRRSGRVLTAEP